MSGQVVMSQDGSRPVLASKDLNAHAVMLDISPSSHQTPSKYHVNATNTDATTRVDSALSKHIITCDSQYTHVSSTRTVEDQILCEDPYEDPSDHEISGHVEQSEYQDGVQENPRPSHTARIAQRHNDVYSTTIDEENATRSNEEDVREYTSMSSLADFREVDDDDASDLGEESVHGSLSQAEKDKKRRRRTNKSEAGVLAAVFEETAFPDIHTRNALAERLNMSLRSVSIWFQNRRQAMKKRASRFGGIDGVRGATVTAFPQVFGEGFRTNEVAVPKLRPSASLDDVANRTSSLSAPSTDMPCENADSALSIEQRVRRMMQPCERKSKAPILDLIRRKQGKSLQRISSLPSIAAKLQGPGTDAFENERRKSHKDLRSILHGENALKPATKLQRSVSMSHLASNPSCKVASTVEEDRPVDLERASTEELIPVQSKYQDTPEIWKRMLSSSSCGFSSDGHCDSDKENRPVETFQETDVFEDEERTLRMIASRRAAREKAKKEAKLSKDGAKYVEEADARLILQQQNEHPTERQQQSRYDRGANRGGSQSISLGRKSSLSRIASLDLSAGRDRSKAPAKPLMEILTEFERIRAAQKREQQQRQDSALRRVQSVRQPHQLLQHLPQRQVHGKGGFMDRHLGMGHTTNPFTRTTSAPLSLLPSHGSHSYSLLSSFTKTHMDRQSNARNGLRDTVPSASQGSSGSSEGNGSEEWTDDWFRERVDGRNHANWAHHAPHTHTVLGSHGGMWNAGTNKRKYSSKLPPSEDVVGHDDSGFFEGSEGEYASDEENRPVSLHKHPAKKVRPTGHRSPLRPMGQTSASSSSPFKRGDERDRLAAETLLGLGSLS